MLSKLRVNRMTPPTSGCAQQLAILLGEALALHIDHQRPERHGSVSDGRFDEQAADSTCAVCGNMSITPAASST